MARSFHNMDLMVALYLSAHKPTPNPIYSLDIEKSNNQLLSLDEVDFHAFIYQLYMGKFTSTTFSNKTFLRMFQTSGQSEEKNIPLDIVNNLKYGKTDFYNEVMKCTA